MGDKLRVRIWETIEKSVGGLLLPWHLKRVGRAQAEVKRYDALMSEQVLREVDALRRGELAFDGTSGLFLPKSDMPQEARLEREGDESIIQRSLRELPARAQEQLVIDHMRRELNLMKAVQVAEEEASTLIDREDGFSAAVDDDWLMRWRTNAEKITSDQVRELWGKILAGEVNRPGSYPLRTLSLLENISAKDALLIERIGPLILDGKWIASVLPERSRVTKFGLTLEDMFALDEIGVLRMVVGVASLQMEIRSKSPTEFSAVIKGWSKTLLLKATNPKLKIAIDAIQLTTAGVHLVALGRFETNEEYLLEIARTIRRDDLKILMGTRVPLPNGERLDNVTEITT